MNSSDLPLGHLAQVEIPEHKLRRRRRSMEEVWTEAMNVNVMNVDLKGEDEEKMNVMIVCGE